MIESAARCVSCAIKQARAIAAIIGREEERTIDRHKTEKVKETEKRRGIGVRRAGQVSERGVRAGEEGVGP